MSSNLFAAALRRLPKPWPIMAIVATLCGGCYAWLYPESLDRGHVFDEISRSPPTRDAGEGSTRVVLERRFPVGSSVHDLISHVVDAGGLCDVESESPGETLPAKSQCSYDSVVFVAFAWAGIGAPDLLEVAYRWDLTVFHADGLIKDYDIAVDSKTEWLESDQYFARLRLQRQAESATAR